MEKIKRFIDCLVPVTTCNLRCHYCYITLRHQFDAKLEPFKYSPRYIAKSLSKKRLGGTCCINLCGGGETLLPPEMPELIKYLLEEGHYIMVVTNGTIQKRFEEIVSSISPELLKKLFFKFSFQFLELKRTNQMDIFFENIKMVRNAGCSFSLEITPNDELIPYIQEIKDLAIKNVGAIPHVTVARDTRNKQLPILTSMSREKYKEIWSEFNSELFNFKFSVFNEKRKEFCYAGDWTYFLILGTGELKPCYKGKTIQNIYEDLDSPIISCPVGYNCPVAHCYNAHAWLTFGAIPDLETPTYLAMRDRITNTGESWVKDPVKSFFSEKLKDNNLQIKKCNRRLISIKSKMYYILRKFYSAHTNGKTQIVNILGIKIKTKK